MRLAMQQCSGKCVRIALSQSLFPFGGAVTCEALCADCDAIVCLSGGRGVNL